MGNELSVVRSIAYLPLEDDARVIVPFAAGTEKTIGRL
jgi:hypothetical protein